MSKNKIHFISIIQIIGMLMIVLSHSVSQYTSCPLFIEIFIQAIQQAGLSAFMWCAGYLLIYTKSIDRYGYGKYIVKRAQRLLTPYVIIQLVMLMPKILVARMQGVRLNINVIYSFMWPREGILPHLWFLPTLMIICVIAPVLCWWIETKTKAVTILLVLMCFLLIPDIPNFLALNDVKQYVFWFSLGMIFAKYVSLEKMDNIYTSVLLCVPVYVCCFLFVGYLPVKYLICNICTLLILNYIGGHFWHQTRFEMLSNYTFSIYILSVPVQNVVEVVAGKMGVSYIISSLAMFFSGLIIPLVIAIGVKIMEKNSKHKLISKCIGL